MNCSRTMVVGLGLRIGLLLTAPAVAATDECGDPSHPWIAVIFAEKALELPLVDAVTNQLRAGLAARAIDVCPNSLPGRANPAATLIFTATDGGGVALTIEVRDAVTAKRVQRDLDLHSIPLDGRALALAVQADELLRATWAELAVKDAPPPRVTVPPAIRSTVAASLASEPKKPSAASRGAVALRGAAEHFTGGLTFLGADLRSDYSLTRASGYAEISGLPLFSNIEPIRACRVTYDANELVNPLC